MRRITTYISIAILLTAVYLPVRGYAAAKLIHMTSVYKDNKEGPIIHPEGVGCNGGSRFIVADSGNGRLVKYLLSGDTIQDGSPLKISGLQHPTRIQYTSGGDIFVLDGSTHSVVRVGANGEIAGTIAPQGLPGQSAMVARSFVLGENGTIYILDVFGERVVVTDAEGSYLKQMRFPGDYGFMSDVAVGPTGGVFLLDSVLAKVYAWNDQESKFVPLTGGMKEYMDFPTNLVIDGRGNFFVLDHNGGGVVVLGRDGSYQGRQLSRGWNEGLLLYPSQICLNEKGEVFIADRDNNRVQVFTIFQ